MKTILVLLAAVPLLCATVIAVDMSGTWTLNLDPDFGGNPDSVECTFKQERTDLAVQCGTGARSTGDVNGQRVRFDIKTGRRNELTATFVADLDADGKAMTGTWHLIDQEKKKSNGKFTAAKH